MRQEQLYDHQMVRVGRKVERGVAVRCGRTWIRAGRQENASTLNMVVDACMMQRSTASLITGIRTLCLKLDSKGRSFSRDGQLVDSREASKLMLLLGSVG